MTMAPWLKDGLLPLVVAALVGLIALALVRMGEMLLPAWDGSYLVLLCILTSLEAHYSHRLLQIRPLRGGDRARFRAIELVMIFFLTRLLYYATIGWTAAVADIRGWSDDPLRIIADPPVFFAFFIALMFWDAAGRTAVDLDHLDLPARVSDDDGVMSTLTRQRLGESVAERLRGAGPYGGTSLDRLSGRFFWGGALLLLASGLFQIGLADLLGLSGSPATGSVAIVLLYFLLGFLVLGLVRYAALRRQWLFEETNVTGDLPARWVRYSLALIALAVFIAFLLPTGYTIGILGLLAALLDLVLVVGAVISMLLYFLIVFPLGWLLSLITGGEPPPPPETPAPAQPLLLPPEPLGAGPEWWQILRSLLFWSILLLTVLYVARAYLQDHPDLARALTSLAPIRVLVTLWRHLVGWLRRQASLVAERLPERWRERGGRLRQATTGRLFRGRARSPREQIFQYYLRMLGHAEAAGHPRQDAETPAEYLDNLTPHVPGAGDALSRLTGTFAEARYRNRATAEQVARARDDLETLRGALRELGEQQAQEDDT
jgi:hypothetical protein